MLYATPLSPCCLPQHRESGESKEFYPNGRLKVSGKIKNGELHGAWQWFRKDGTLLRTETYKNGSRVSLP